MNVFHVSCRNFRSIAQLLAGLACAYIVLHVMYAVVMSQRKTTASSNVNNPDIIPALLKFGQPDMDGQVQVVVSFDAKDLAKAWAVQNQKQVNNLNAVNIKGVPPEINVLMQNPFLCTNLSDLQWVVLVKSGPDDQEKRQLLRDTWADVKLFRKDLFRVLFLLGHTADEVVQRKLKSEFDTYKDLAQGDFIDSEKNATLKVIMGLKWVASHCPQARYVIKANDNTFMNIFEMIKMMDASKERSRIIICPLWKDNTMPILRDPSECGIWCVKEDELPGRKYFPQYCAGMGFVMSQEVVVDLYEASQTTPFFWIDDVYVTGLVTQQVKKEIHYVDVLSQFTLKEDLVYDQYVNNGTISVAISMMSNAERLQKVWRALIRRLPPTQFKLLSDSAIARHM